MNPFAEWIAKVGLTKHDVAEAWGVNDTAIWKITRNNGHRISSDTALRIWRFTGGAVTLDQLLVDGTEPASESEEHQAALKAIRDRRARKAQKRKERIDAKRKKSANPELRPVEPSNDLNDEQKAALFIGGIEKLEKLIENKDWAVAEIRNARKVMKSEGFDREEIDYALWLRKEGDEKAKERIAVHVRIAEWLGKPLGFQSTLDLGVAAQ